jgi:hypothetical protein
MIRFVRARISAHIRAKDSNVGGQLKRRTFLRPQRLRQPLTRPHGERPSALQAPPVKTSRSPLALDHRAIAKRFAKSVARTVQQPPPESENPTYHWIVNETRLPYLKLDIIVPVATILSELENIQDLFVPHLDYGSTQGWYSFCLHGKAYDATREDSFYPDERPYDWTPEALERMPETVRYFQHLWPHDRYQRLRVMRLSPGGYIGVHQDSSTCRLGPINIAVTQPAKCQFLMEGCGVIPFVEGDSILLNVSYRHAVFNDSPNDRYHIIIHQNASDEFENLVIRSYQSMHKRVQLKT